ncbi:MAG TPA: 3-hydroxyacyl-CoA dehydrogenase NAD-binding domain-containing protein [Stellaceae bacterium]|nr:3-hydroxyacyl-CoA dehydrogenase NAD-binding domain-containing protein [Stellaceae bacterium]
MADVRLERAGEIAVIEIDNPPVNALSHAVRAALASRLDEAIADEAIKAAVIVCTGRTFIAGADINELGKPRSPPLTVDLTTQLDACTKPVVAAIHGTALGGGLELALACHWRVASPDARLGLPEVKLGIIPGGGGTQRLPRAIGAKAALDMIVSGEPIGAHAALDAGLVDALATHDDLRTAAVALARRIVAEKRLPKRLRDRAVAPVPAEMFSRARSDVAHRHRGFEAPLKAVDAVTAAMMRFDDGLKREQTLFADLLRGPQFGTLRHVFFAEREAAKIPDLPADLPKRDIGHAAVIGAGTMGGGIALCFADAGIPVTLIDSDRIALERGLGTLRKNFEASARRRNLSAAELDKRLAMIKPSLRLADAATADIVIEAVFEDLALKQNIFGKLDAIVKPGAILASNTSYQDIDVIAASTKRSTDVLGLHFFSPAHVMRLVEVVRASATAPAVLAASVALARKLRKLPVIVGPAPGFVGNRMLFERSREAERLLRDGALPRDVDQAMVEFGFPMGPFAAADLAGLDISWSIRKAHGVSFPIADALCEAGRFGQKTGKGYYRYEAGSREGLADPETDRIVAEVRQKLGITPKPIAAGIIVERLIYPMVNQAARLLDDGVALRPGDIDLIWINGYGFPAWRGGPMFYADQIGLANVRDRLAHLERELGEKALVPAPLIERRVTEGRGFYS